MVSSVGFYRELVEQSDDIIIVTDSLFNIRYASAAVRRFNIAPESLTGQNLFDHIQTDRAEQWRSCLQNFDDPFSDEISLNVSDGRKLYFDVFVRNLMDDVGREGLALHLHEITAKKSKEADLIRANQQLDQVIYKTTHDLRSPVRSAMGLVNLAKNATLAEKDQYIEMIGRSLHKLDDLIEEMNDFFRNDKLALKREVVHLMEEIHEEIDLLDFTVAGKKIRVDLQMEGTTPFYSDVIRVRTILTNILSNAIKYSDPNKSEPFIKIIVLINEENCQIRIVDNGIGIKEEYHSRIFDLFFRATDQSQGTGLGLFIVKDTIQKLNGSIEVTSQINQGTTFRIQIPNQIHQPALAV